MQIKERKAYSMQEKNLELLRQYQPENGMVTEVKWIEDINTENPLKACWEGVTQCYSVKMEIKTSERSMIHILAYLPEKEQWNGKFLGTGNGGYAGELAEGALKNGVCRGYASVNTDLRTAKDVDDDIGNEEVWKDFGHRATHVMTVEGKHLTEYFYGKKTQYAYFLGGSTGGQQAFSEAEKYPKDYDGIIAMSPAMDRTCLHSFFVYNWQQIHGRKNATFTPDICQKWKACLVKEYGKLCGNTEKDDFLTYPGRIRVNPMDNPHLQETIQTLFTEGQREALRAIYEGPKDPATGERVIAPFLPGTEAEGLSLMDYCEKEKFAYDFFYLYRWIWGKDFDFMNFDFDRNLKDAVQKLGPELDATNPDLEAYRKHGGKLLVIGGSSDAIIPYTGFLDFYRKVVKEQGDLEKTKNFFRFFLLPGFGHTFWGPGVQDVGTMGLSAIPKEKERDMICTMEAWVEHGEAPERMLGTHYKIGAEGLCTEYVRPAYAYPYIAVYKGGDPNEPEHYEAVEDAASYK